MSVPRYWREIPYRFRLEGVICKNCNHAFVPARKVCPVCGSTDLEHTAMPRTGTLITYSIIHTAPRGYIKQAPYAIGVIELDNGARVTAQITDCDFDEIKIGMRVEAVFRRITEHGDAGIIKYGYKFRPLFATKTE